VSFLHKGAQFAFIKIKNFYLDMQMVDPEYIWIKVSDILKELTWNMGWLERKTTIGGSTLKDDVAAMGYPRLVYWPTTSFVDD
jgi:hypothetical protein